MSVSSESAISSRTRLAVREAGRSTATVSSQATSRNTISRDVASGHDISSDAISAHDTSSGSDVFSRGFTPPVYARSVAEYKMKCSASRRLRRTVIPQVFPRLTQEAEDSFDDGDHGYPPRLQHLQLQPAKYVGGVRRVSRSKASLSPVSSSLPDAGGLGFCGVLPLFLLLSLLCFLAADYARYKGEAPPLGDSGGWQTVPLGVEAHTIRQLGPRSFLEVYKSLSSSTSTPPTPRPDLPTVPRLLWKQNFRYSSMLGGRETTSEAVTWPMVALYPTTAVTSATVATTLSGAVPEVTVNPVASSESPVFITSNSSMDGGGVFGADSTTAGAPPSHNHTLVMDPIDETGTDNNETGPVLPDLKSLDPSSAPAFPTVLLVCGIILLFALVTFVMLRLFCCKAGSAGQLNGGVAGPAVSSSVDLPTKDLLNSAVPAPAAKPVTPGHSTAAVVSASSVARKCDSPFHGRPSSSVSLLEVHAIDGRRRLCQDCHRSAMAVLGQGYREAETVRYPLACTHILETYLRLVSAPAAEGAGSLESPANSVERFLTYLSDVFGGTSAEVARRYTTASDVLVGPAPLPSPHYQPQPLHSSTMQTNDVSLWMGGSGRSLSTIDGAFFTAASHPGSQENVSIPTSAPSGAISVVRRRSDGDWSSVVVPVQMGEANLKRATRVSNLSGPQYNGLLRTATTRCPRIRFPRDVLPRTSLLSPLPPTTAPPISTTSATAPTATSATAPTATSATAPTAPAPPANVSSVPGPASGAAGRLSLGGMGGDVLGLLQRHLQN